MILTDSQSIYLINGLEIMGSHKLGFMMINTAIITKEKMFCFAISRWNSILTVATLVIRKFEVFFVRQCESSFVKNIILIVSSKEEVILKCVILTLFRNNHRVTFGNIVFWISDSA